MYLKRSLESVIKNKLEDYSVLVIYGAREVGKLELVTNLFDVEIKTISLDDLENRTFANEFPRLFLEMHPWPIIIQEIQNAIPLLRAIRETVDDERERCLSENKHTPFMYALLGSNSYELEDTVKDVLEDRAMYYALPTLTTAEIERYVPHVFDPNLTKVWNRYDSVNKKKVFKTKPQLFERIFKGGYPEYNLTEIDRTIFFNYYITLYMEKIVHNIIAIDKESDFLRFLNVMALKTGQQINYDDIARNVDIDARTVRNWISILVTTGIGFTLKSYARALSDRVTKMERFYFFDTGLCSYLCKFSTSEELMKSKMSQAFFETYVISEIAKTYINAGIDYRKCFYYYKDRDNKEVSLIIEFEDYICPIAIQKGDAQPHKNFNFNFLKKYIKPVEKGLLLEIRKDLVAINEDNWRCPIYLIGL